MAKSDPDQKLLAEPSGTIAWTAEMRKHLQHYATRLAAEAAGRLAATHDFARNREACESVFSGYWGKRRSRELQAAAVAWPGCTRLAAGECGVRGSFPAELA